MLCVSLCSHLCEYMCVHPWMPNVDSGCLSYTVCRFIDQDEIEARACLFQLVYLAISTLPA